MNKPNPELVPNISKIQQSHLSSAYLLILILLIILVWFNSTQQKLQERNEFPALEHRTEKRSRMTVVELKRDTGLELSDEDGENVIDSLQKLSSIICELYINDHRKRHGKV